MAREEIRIDITAEDDASEKLDDVADKAQVLEGPGGHVSLDVAAHTDEALADLARLDAAAEGTTGELGKLESGAQGGRNAMANMVGNAAQDVGELGGVAGTAGVAVGQLAEAAADGNLEMNNLAGTIGPMVALGVATKVISDHFAKVAASKAFEADQVQGWVDAMREGKSLTEAIADNYREAGKVELAVGDDTVDITHQLAELNLTVEDFNRLAGMSEDELRAWSREQAAAGVNTAALGLVVLAANDQAGQMADSTRDAADATEVLGKKAEDTAAQTAALDEAFDRLKGTLSAQGAYLDAQQGFDDVKAAADEAYLAAATGSAGAEQAARDHQRELLGLKQTVIDYATEVGGIPPSQVTDILALIDQGKLAEAEAALAALQGTRTTTVNIAKGSGWADLTGMFDWAHRGGGATTNVTINAPRGTRPEDLIAAGTAYARRNGGRVFR